MEAKHRLGKHKCSLALFIVFLVLLFTAYAGSRIFTVEETDFVKINAQAYDPDDDQLSYTYSLPLNEKGEWQTTYDDAGEYQLEIKVSDGIHEASEEVTLIVNNKNQPPQLSDNKITVKEAQTTDLKTLVSDPDGDPLKYVFEEPFDSNGKWATSYDDAGDYITTVQASDGKFTEEFRVGVTVLNTKRPLQIKNSVSTEVGFCENQILKYWVDVDAEDGVSYRWRLDDNPLGEERAGEYQFDYDSAGKHEIKVIINDGFEEVTKSWQIEVCNVNRKPNVKIKPFTVHEGDEIVMELPEKDDDNDLLSYTFPAPFDDKGTWQTDFEDGGNYNLKIKVSDSALEVEETIKITVLETDRAPSLILPRSIQVKEGTPYDLMIDTTDPDKDELKLSFENLPENSIYDDESKTLMINAGYDTIKRDKSFFADLLNNLRLEHLFLTSKTVPIKVISCGKELCSAAETNLIVRNVNQPPQFNLGPNATTLYLKETEKLSLNLTATDPDGDLLRYFYQGPAGRSRQWQTDYGDKGTYYFNVTASDGLLESTISMQVDVLKNNRQPSLKIKKDRIVVNEGEEFSLSMKAADPDNDSLSIYAEDLPEGASFREGVFTWQPSYRTVSNRTVSKWNNFIGSSPFLNKRLNKDQEIVWLQFIASDGEDKVVHPVKVIVKNVNEAPKILDYLPQKETSVKVNDAVLFHAAVKDLDQDLLQYEWDFGFGQGKVRGTDTVKRTFKSSGTKKIKMTATDGLQKVEQEWIVEVEGEKKKKKKDSTEKKELPEEEFKFNVYVVKG